MGKERLYEWDQGHGLRYVGFVPKEGGGEEAVEAVGGSPASNNGNRLNAISEDGSRVFFSAKRAAEAAAGEAGKEGVFAREDGTSTRDVSASETLTPDTGAEYQGATPDGRRVYFTANAGIAESGASEAGTTDLYEYDFAKPEGERLTDISATEEAGGARVGALVGFAADGSHVYFIARGQLVPGQGPILAQNEAANTYSLYEHRGAGSENRFVGTVKGTSEELRRVTVDSQAESASRVSPDGRYLLFQSRARVTGYDSGGAPEAYLYDAEAGPGEEATVCVSCRQDGGAPTDAGPTGLLAFGGPPNKRYQPQSLVVRDGQPVAFFRSKDALAPGGVEGLWNLYEWSHGQVFHIDTEAAATASPGTAGRVTFAGASQGGEDVYFFGDTALNWENPEGRPQAWDARIGGGFAEPPAPPAPCEAGSEGACRRAAPAPPGAASPASKDFSGAGNVKPKPHKHKKAHKKKRHRHHHKKRHKGRGHAKRHKGKKKGHAKKTHTRANHDRRASK